MSEASTSTAKRHAEFDDNEPVKRTQKFEPQEDTDSDGAATAGLPTKPKPEDIFKIDETLAHILNNLEVADLLNAYNVNKKFREIVLDIIGEKKIAFDEFRDRISTAKVFKLIGKHMKKLQIHDWDVRDYPAQYSDIAKFIDIITKYGSPGKLVELEMRFRDCIFGFHTEQLFQRARPFFENVRNLFFDTINRDNVTFFNMFPLNNLQTISLGRVNDRCGWLNSPELQNLQHLYIEFVNPFALVDFPRFFELNPNLKSFYCHYNLQFHIESIAHHLPNIENLGRLHNISREQIHCFGRFNRLKRVAIQVNGTGSDLFEMLENLPNKHVLEVLELNLGYSNHKNPNEAIIKRLPTIMQQFTSLNWLKLNNLFPSCKKFLLTILPQLSTVTKCTVHGFESYPEALFQFLARLLKNLRVLVVHLAFTKKFYRQLMEIWKKRQQEESFSYPLVITVGPRKYDSNMIELRSIYDENVVRFEK